MWTSVGLTALVCLALGAASYRYNIYIDDNPAHVDGVTSFRVAGGVLYTLLGAAAIVGIWWGWEAAGMALSSFFVAFVASGFPMMAGDISRSHRDRVSGPGSTDGTAS